MMVIFRKSRGPVLRTITIGKTWLIDGEPVEARDAQTALRQIYDAHELFPVFVDVENPSGQVLHLTMDENGDTSQREHDELADDEQDLATDVLQGPDSANNEQREAEDAPELEEQEPTDEEDSEPAGSTVASTAEAPPSDDVEATETPAGGTREGREPVEAEEAPELEEQGLAGGEGSEPAGAATAVEALAANRDPLGGADGGREAVETRKGSDRRWSKMPLVIASATVVVIGLGAIGVNALAQENEAGPGAPAESPTPEQAVTLGEGATPLWLSDRVAVVEDDGAVRLINPATGDQIGDDINADAGKIRAMSSESGDVITTGEGQFVIYDGDKNPQTYDGTLNLRGTQPVAVDGREFSTMDNPASTQDASKDAAVFGATEEGVVLAKAPATTIVGGSEIKMSQPHDDAEVVEWVQAGSEAYALLWSPVDDGETVLALHDPETGKVMSKTEVSEDEVNVSSGTASIGDDRYLEGKEIKDLCDGGNLIGGSPVCPSEGGTWKNADGIELAEIPRAISDSFYISPNNEIREIGQ